MTEDQISCLEASFAQASQHADELVDTFYDILFRSSPELRRLFPVEMSEQKQKLGATLGTAVRLWRQPDVLVPELRALGARHERYGVRTRDYMPVGVALIGALAHVLGPDFTPQIRHAWVDAFAFISSTMLEGVVEDETVSVL